MSLKYDKFKTLKGYLENKQFKHFSLFVWTNSKEEKCFQNALAYFVKVKEKKNRTSKVEILAQWHLA